MVRSRQVQQVAPGDGFMRAEAELLEVGALCQTQPPEAVVRQEGVVQGIQWPGRCGQSEVQLGGQAPHEMVSLGEDAETGLEGE